MHWSKVVSLEGTFLIVLFVFTFHLQLKQQSRKNNYMVDEFMQTQK